MITADDGKKQHSLQGEVIDKAERLSEWLTLYSCVYMVLLINSITILEQVRERLGQFREAHIDSNIYRNKNLHNLFNLPQHT